jgi:hypothetical protein
VLLRSQTLLSSARTINFSPSNPQENAKDLTLDVRLTIWIVMACLITPLILVFKPFSFATTLFSLTKACLIQACNRNIADQQHSDQKPPSGEHFDSPQGFKATVGHDGLRHEKVDEEPASATIANSEPASAPTSHTRIDVEVTDSRNAHAVTSHAKLWTDFVEREINVPNLNQLKASSVMQSKRIISPDELWKSDIYKRRENRRSHLPERSEYMDQV